MKKLISLVLALCLVALCGLAFADEPVDPFATTSTVAVTVNGVKSGDTLHLYKIATPSKNENNELVLTWINEKTQNAIASKDNEGNDFATNAPLQAAIAKLIADGDLVVSGDGNPKATASGESVSVNAAPGYYLAIVKGGDENVGTIYQNMLINVVPVPDSATGTWTSHAAVTINAKKTTVELDKKQKENGGNDWVATTVEGYKVGELIPFQITTSIPSYPSNAKYATFEISDNPTGLMIINNYDHHVTVTVGGSEVTQFKADGTTRNYTLTVNNGNLSIIFEKSFVLANPGAAVTVNYRAELIANDSDIEVDETKNTAKIKYNRNPDEDTYYEPDTEIKQKTYNFTLLKHEAGDESKKLVGAKFTLWTAETNGTQIALIKDGDVYRPIKDGETAVDYIEVDANGEATVVGLAKTTYYLQEDIAPAGYTRLNGRQAAPANESTSTVGIDHKIPNTPGAELPSTGGIGTTIFYIIGGLLLVGAAVILVARRKAHD